MGPAACFDKSFLQSLSVDESVWFDAYFLSVITPLFYVETLADLEKRVKEGRTPEQEVGGIANKTPEVCGTPTLFHAILCQGELCGYDVPMNHRPVLKAGKRSLAGEKKALLFEEAEEAKALARWTRGEFLEVERLYAKVWREMLATPDPAVGERLLRRGLNEAMGCKNLRQILELARSVVDDDGTPEERMQFIFDVVPIREDRSEIYSRYRRAECPPIRKFAPYLAHVLDVEVFFRLATKKGLISLERPSASRWTPPTPAP